MLPSYDKRQQHDSSCKADDDLIELDSMEALTE